MTQPKPRIRLLFSNGVLAKTQKKSGLKRSWVGLKPQFETISDVVSYIFHSFDLHKSCPYGINLNMDGFVLPEFESTSILKDKDLINVKRKESGPLIATKTIEESKTCIKDMIVEKLLPNEEFDKEIEGYQNETDKDKDGVVKSTSLALITPNGDLASKKRKTSSKLQSPKKKRKLRHITDIIHAKLFDCDLVTKPSKKRRHENKSNENALSSSDVIEKCANDLKPGHNSARCSDLKKNKKDTIQISTTPDKAKKVSRSTLRKRTKRLLRKLQRDKDISNEKCDIQQTVVKDTTDITGSKMDIVPIMTQQEDEDSDAEGDLVPVMVRPGLMRFIPSGKEKDVQENPEANALDAPSTQNGTCEEYSAPKNGSKVKHDQVAKEAYCWNGITNKRKGQKWGQDTQPNSPWKESRNASTDCRGTCAARNQSVSWEESQDVNGQSNDTLADKKHQSNDKSVDFEKLIPLSGLPKEGDVIAYRLLELSSSWCPELSSFRVGRITSSELNSQRIMLAPVPEFPLNLNKDDDDDEEQPPAPSVYNEDDSLETDFASLSDVRIMNLDNLTQSENANGIASPSTSKRNNETQKSKEVASNVELHQSEVTKIPSANTAVSSPSTSKKNVETQNAKEIASNLNKANGKKDVWEEIAEAVSAKKAELMQEDSWNNKENPPKRPWSYRSLRNIAIGPIMARLREQSGV